MYGLFNLSDPSDLTEARLFDNVFDGHERASELNAAVIQDEHEGDVDEWLGSDSASYLVLPIEELLEIAPDVYNYLMN